MPGVKWSDFLPYIQPLVDSLRYTVGITAVVMVISLAAAILVALARSSRFVIIRGVSLSYVEFIRSTPFLVQLYYIFYVLPQFHITLSAVVAGVIGLSLAYTAYLSEVYRAAISSIPVTQIEAATSLGFTYWQTTLRIVLPQAARVALPPTMNYLLSLVKDTSLLSIITIQELMFTGLLLASRTFQYFVILTEVAIIYFIICFPLTIASRRLERRLDAEIGLKSDRRRVMNRALAGFKSARRDPSS